MTTTAGRLVRAAVVAFLLLLAVPAGAAGTGGVEVTPLPGIVDGKQVTAFHVRMPRSGTSEVPFALRNLTGEPAHGDALRGVRHARGGRHLRGRGSGQLPARPARGGAGHPPRQGVRAP